MSGVISTTHTHNIYIQLVFRQQRKSKHVDSGIKYLSIKYCLCVLCIYRSPDGQVFNVDKNLDVENGRMRCLCNEVNYVDKTC